VCEILFIARQPFGVYTKLTGTKLQMTLLDIGKQNNIPFYTGG
jgi:hypothetical protein